MNASRPAPIGMRSREWWGHVIAAAAACLLTVSIVGSVAYLAIHAYRTKDERERISIFINSLENRSPEDLAHAVTEVQRRPALAARVLPSILASLKRTGSERRQLAAIQFCRGFVDDPSVQKAMYRLRLARSETVASQAVDALRSIRPPRKAAESLAKCMDVQSESVVDVICCGLIDLGRPGVDALRSFLNNLDVSRRAWLAGLIEDRRSMTAIPVLRSLLNDRDPSVRHNAARALGRLTGEGFTADDSGVARARDWMARQPGATGSG